MSSNILNEDLRSVKTEKALHAAMFTLLEKNSFRKITIKRICEEALISRATFYAHFIDKYDLLKHWIIELWPKGFHGDDAYEEIEKVVNHHISDNMLILRNLVYEADDETFDILFDFFLATLDLTVGESGGGEALRKNIVLSNFYAGGILSYFLWQVKNKFPADVPPMNRYLYEMIREFQDWKQDKDRAGGSF